VKTISSHAHKTGSWYLLGALLKISHDHPILFTWESPLGVKDLLASQFMLFSGSYWLTAEDQAMSDWKMKCCSNKVHFLIILWP